MPTNSYFLTVNDVIETSGVANASGNLSFTALPAGSPDVLDITSLAIQNGSSNNVLSTTLP